MKNYSMKVYKLDTDSMIIISSTLEAVVNDSAETTTTPRGVGAKLHIEEYEGKYQLRMWGISGNGNRLLDEFDTFEEARQERLDRLYKSDFIESDEYGKWFESEEEAISDYVDAIKWEDDTITIESVKEQIETARKEMDEYKARTGARLTKTMQEACDLYEKNGQVTKNLTKTARNILYGGEHYNGNLDIYITYRELVSVQTLAMAKSAATL